MDLLECVGCDARVVVWRVESKGRWVFTRWTEIARAPLNVGIRGDPRL